MSSTDSTQLSSKQDSQREGTQQQVAPALIRQVPLFWGAGLLLCSGMCSLVFQVIWFREFRLVFGASTAASSAVLAVFMGGLGIGNALLGTRVDRTKNPLRLYAWLELSVALTAAISPFLIDAFHDGYIVLGGQLSLGFIGATALRLLISVIVLGLPTFLMGGTLPAAVRAVTVDGDRQRRGAAVLYGANTFGAVIGAFGSTFYVVQHLGTRNTLWAACLLNAVTACTAFAMSRRVLSPTTPHPSPTTSDNAAVNLDYKSEPLASPFVIYAVAGIAGFSFFLMELIWYRMLGPILGGTTYTFGLILSVALIGIGLGAAVYPLIFSGRRQVSLHSLALICVLEAFCILIPFALGDEIAILAARLRGTMGLSFTGEVASWFIVASIVVLPAAFVSGLQFPMVIASLGQGDRDIGQQVGLTFGWNTVGAICGSFAGGFGLLPLLSAPEVWRYVALLLILQGLCLIGLTFRKSMWTLTTFATLAISIATVAMSARQGPTAVWRHSGIGAGVNLTTNQLETSNSRRGWQNAIRRSIIWEAEGVESSVAIRCNESLSFIVNGKSDGNAIFDASTQIMLGQIGAVLHPEPKTAFVVGLGTGETAGWLAEVPTMERVDVIELEPAVMEVTRRCSPVNFNVLAHPKVRTIINDAREVLLTTRDRYDLIVCEPSNPYRSGVANLFTDEFYRAGRQRLNEGGLFVQWIQAYETDDRTMRTLFATFRSVFPHVEIWESQRADLVLVGHSHQPQYPVADFRKKLATEPFASALLYAWQTTGVEGFFAHYIGGPSLVDQFIKSGDSAINTDDRNEIEYAFARTVGMTNVSTTATLHRMSAAIGDQRPPTDDADVNWQAVRLDREWFSKPNVGSSGESPSVNRVLERFAAADLPGMFAAWESRAEGESTCLAELAIVTLQYAKTGSRKAEPLIERLRSSLPIEADMIRGILARKQGRDDEACNLLVTAIQQLRHNPWPMAIIRENAFDAAIEVSGTHPDRASRILDALSEPFLVAVADENRRDCACLIAANGPPEKAVQFVETFEPYVPWSQRFLKFRKQIYTQSGHPLARQADRDLQEFLRNAINERSPR